MTKAEATRFIAALKGAHPRTPFPPESVVVYAENIMDLPAGVTGRAVAQLIQTSNFMPTIAEIRAAVAELVCGLPTPEDAWAEIERALRRYDPNNSGTWTYPHEFSHSLIGEVLVTMGGLPRLDTSNTFATDRREYMRLYDTVRTERVHQEQTSLGPGGAPTQLPVAVEGNALPRCELKRINA